jgi:protein-disulfide isomerase
VTVPETSPPGPRTACGEGDSGAAIEAPSPFTERGLGVFLFSFFLAACAAAPPRASVPAPLESSATPVAGLATGPPMPAEDDAGVPVAPGDPTWGSRNALVTIVEFADFECPFCARVEPTLARVREAYGPDKLRIVWKNNPLPFHPSARPAAEAAVGVYALGGNDAFWRFRALAFARDRELGVDAYVAWAKKAGLADPDALVSGLRSHVWATKVDADIAEARQVGSMGTPEFFVNGVSLAGAQPFENFRALIDAQMVAAGAKVVSGTPRERVYAVLSKENVAAAPRGDDDEAEDTKTVYKVPIGKSPVRGGAAALVTIVEFADYECPYCLRVETTLRELRVDYGDKVRFVFKDEPLPFHPRAEPAAQAALEVRAEKGDDAFWAMHDTLLGDPGDLGDDTLVRLAAGAGARADKVRSAIAKHTHKAEIEADLDLADDLQANGTPHFFIDGRRVVGAQTKEQFKAIIDEEIKKAQALIEAGTRSLAVYDAMTKDGRAPPEPERMELRALPAGDPARGPATAKVVVHEFADFQCPYCAHAEATLKEIFVAYGDRVRFVWHDMPLSFHQNALPAARAAREARTQHGDRAFWELHDKLFADGSKLSRADLDADARSLGLDMGKWAAALDGDAHRAEIDEDRAAAESIGLTGTPSFLVVPSGATSGYMIAGAQSYAKFRKLIERALADAAAQGNRSAKHPLESPR